MKINLEPHILKIAHNHVFQKTILILSKLLSIAYLVSFCFFIATLLVIIIKNQSLFDLKHFEIFIYFIFLIYAQFYFIIFLIIPLTMFLMIVNYFYVRFNIEKVKFHYKYMIAYFGILFVFLLFGIWSQ